MVKQTKMTTVSVRIEEDLMKRLDTVTAIVSVNKSDFIRACLKKLCDDNKMMIDHSHRVTEYINYIKKEISKLPVEMVAIKNGSLDEAKESTILILCDQLWNSSKTVFDNWLKLLREYNVTTEITRFSQAEESQGLVSLEDIALLLAEKSGMVEHPDIGLLINEDDWIDSLETSRISLSYACKKAFEEQSAQTIIKEVLEKERERKREGPQRLVIDVKGAFRRSGSLLYLPVYTEEIQQGS